MRLLLLINTASPALAYSRRSSLLIAPPFYTIGGAISFYLLIITIYPPRACLPRLGFADRFGRLRRRDVRARRSHLPVRMPCDFLEVSYGTACPVLACPSRRDSSVLPLHGTPLVMSSFQSLRSLVSPLTSYRLAPRIIDKRGGEKMRSSSAGGHRRRMADGGRCRGCLLASDGVGSDGIAVGAGPSCLLVMGAMGGAGGHLSSPSPRLIPSAMPPPGSSNRLGPGSSHRRGGGFFSFSPDPLPPALLCLLAVACSPVLGRGMCGLRHGLRWRAAGCLLAFLVPRSALSLPLVRLLLYDPCRSCRSFLLGVLWGVLWAILPAILSALAFFKTCP